MKRKTFLIVTVLIAVCGLSVSAAIGWNRGVEKDRQMRKEACSYSSAFWKVNFKTPDDLVNGVDTVVLAEPIASWQSRVAYSSNGEDALPFEVVQFRVIQNLKGDFGETVVHVERAGGIDPDGNVVNLSADGGNFEKGGQYLLFLKHQEDGKYYYQVNNQGRYHVKDGVLNAVDAEDHVARFFNKKQIDESLQLVREINAKGKE